MSKFYVSCPVGFEAELISELKEFWFEMMDLDGLPTRVPFPELETWPGGVEFEVEDHIGYQINFFSKLANRVLVRIAHFNSRYFDQFEKELQKVTLEKWLSPQPIQVKVEYHKSRLNNEKNLIEAMTNSLGKKKYKVLPKNDGDEPTLYLRLQNDFATVSLDTSGEHLHRRGYAQYRGEAPIRETLAAMMVRQLLKRTSINEDLTVVDPFAGSGTILFETASYREAALKRKYTWFQFLNRPKLFKSETWLKNFRWLQATAQLKMFAFDQDDKSIVNIEKNKALFEQVFPLVKLEVDFEQADSGEVDLAKLKDRKNIWLITNPPYGHRLEEGDALSIIERFERELPLAGVIVLHPESWYFNFENLRLSSQLDFKNQGLKLKLSVYTL